MSVTVVAAVAAVMAATMVERAQGMVYYVSPNASTSDGGKGSVQEPWSLSHVLAGKTRVRAGDTVQLMDGVYSHALPQSAASAALRLLLHGDGGGGSATRFHCRSLRGTADAFITFEAAPGALPIVDVASVWSGDDDADLYASFAIDCDFTRWRRL